jgi:predicted aspartyl protease
LTLTTFDPSLELIYIQAWVTGPRGNEQELRLVFDPGASYTQIQPAILDSLGYNPRDGERITRVGTVAGQEHGYLIRVVRFRALGFELQDCRINAMDLDEDIDGLLGLSFLRNFNYEVRSRAGEIRTRRVSR